MNQVEKFKMLDKLINRTMIHGVRSRYESYLKQAELTRERAGKQEEPLKILQYELLADRYDEEADFFLHLLEHLGGSASRTKGEDNENQA